MARLTTDISRFGGAVKDTAALVGTAFACLAGGILIGIFIEREVGCARKASHTTIRTLTTPSLILQDGVWVTERQVAERVAP